MSPKTANPKDESQHRSLTVPTGVVFEHDAATGPLLLHTLQNEGTIRIFSSREEIAECVVRADEVFSTGDLTCELAQLILDTPSFNGARGELSAVERILIKNRSDITIKRGIFKAPSVDFETCGKLSVQAQRIDGAASATADSVVFGVKEGSLNIVETKIAGDPIYYNTDGDVDITVAPTNGDDLYIFATGSITVNAIDTAGGGATHTGIIILNAGLAAIDDGTPPVNSVTELACSYCFPTVQQDLSFTQSSNPQGNVTINGDVKGQSFEATGNNITIDGNLTITQVNTTIVGSGAASFGNNGSIQITGNVKILSADGSQGSLNCTGTQNPANTQNVTVGGTIHANVNIATFGPGAITLSSDVTADDHIQIFAPYAINQLPSCGDGAAIGAVSANVDPTQNPSTTIQTQNLTANNQIVLFSTGNIQTGNLTATESTQPDAVTLAHTIAIFANFGQDNTAPVFNVGGGGSNGCGKIINRGINSFGGVVGVNNPGGISVTTSDLVTTTANGGTPGIIFDCATATVTLDGGLNVNGSASESAGYIGINAATLQVPAAVTITASDTNSSDSPPPAIYIAVSEIPLTGNLTVRCNSSTPQTQIWLGPTDSIEFGWETVQFFPCFHQQVNAGGALMLTGSGDLTVEANSDFAQINITGTPTTFNIGTVDVHAMGNSTAITIDYDENPQGNNSLISSGGSVSIKATDPNGAGNGGSISILADGVNITSTFAAHADALATSSGNGGYVSLLANSDITFGGTSSLLSAHANTGTGGNITLQSAGAITVNTGAGNVEIDAKATGTGGSGGSVTVTSTGSAVTINSADLKVASGTNGNGGKITAQAQTNLSVMGNLNVSATGTGNAGSVSLNGIETLAFSGTNQKITADAASSGNAGSM